MASIQVSGEPNQSLISPRSQSSCNALTATAMVEKPSTSNLVGSPAAFFGRENHAPTKVRIPTGTLM